MVMVPTYNERENIISLIDSILGLNIPNISIVVVDDNSPDGTWQLVEEKSSENPNVFLLHRKKKLFLH